MLIPELIACPNDPRQNESFGLGSGGHFLARYFYVPPENKYSKGFQATKKYPIAIGFNLSFGKFYFYHKGTKSTKDFFLRKNKKNEACLPG